MVTTVSEREKHWHPTGVVGDSGKGRCGRVCSGTRVQARMIQGKNRKMGGVWP